MNKKQKYLLFKALRNHKHEYLSYDEIKNICPSCPSKDDILAICYYTNMIEHDGGYKGYRLTYLGEDYIETYLDAKRHYLLTMTAALSSVAAVIISIISLR